MTHVTRSAGGQRTACVIPEGHSACQEAKLLENRPYVTYKTPLCADFLAVEEKKKVRDHDKKSGGGGGGL